MSLFVEVPFNPFVTADFDVELQLAGLAYESAEVIHEKIVDLMEEPKHGNSYRHKDNSIRPASEEGEAPGINSKDLVGSFDVIALSTLEAQINSDVDHGTILQEYRNRPFTEPAIEQALPEIYEKIEDRLEENWR